MVGLLARSIEGLSLEGGGGGVGVEVEVAVGCCGAEGLPPVTVLGCIGLFTCC